MERIGFVGLGTMGAAMAANRLRQTNRAHVLSARINDFIRQLEPGETAEIGQFAGPEEVDLVGRILNPHVAAGYVIWMGPSQIQRL